MASERLYVVAYDIADRKRWQKVFKTMKGYGHCRAIFCFDRLNGSMAVVVILLNPKWKTSDWTTRSALAILVHRRRETRSRRCSARLPNDCAR